MGLSTCKWILTPFPPLCTSTSQTFGVNEYSEYFEHLNIAVPEKNEENYNISHNHILVMSQNSIEQSLYFYSPCMWIT